MLRLRYLIFIFCLAYVLNASTDNSNEDKDARRRVFIENFISDYKSAYQKEKIDYIRLFFSQDALMITETKELLKIGSEIAPNSTKSRPYKLLVENRAEYITRLSDVFAKNGGINIGISNLLIRKHPKYPDIYGIYFFQIWDDTGVTKALENQMPGYVFLMLDFRDSEITPIIHVRTWQPKSNISKPSDKYSLEDFRIISYK
jgi:hypothetical protein